MPKSAPRAANPYSVHPSVAMVQDWVASLKQKTGRSLDEWLTLVKKKGPKDSATWGDWLKREHKLGTNSAGWIADRAAGRGTEDDDPKAYLAAAVKYVDAMFAGPKAALRPLYDTLLKVCLATGREAKVCPCQTMVPIFRNHVIAQIKPSTRTRIDLGLWLATCKEKLPARIISTGGLEKKDRITHRIEITSRDDIDAEVKRWLKTCYDLDG